MIKRVKGMSVSSIYIEVNGERVRVIEQKDKKKAREEGFEEVEAFYYGEFLSGKNKGKRGIIVKKDGKNSLFKLFFAIFLGVCLNIIDFDLIRHKPRYARAKPRIENHTS